MSSTKLSNILTVPPKNKNASGTVIFLHGSGDTGEGIKEWIDSVLNKEFSFPHLRVIFPTAPLQPYSPLSGQLSNVWFNRLGINPDVPEHMESLEVSGNEIKKLIDNEVSQGIPINRIIVGGFSMGGGLALHVAYRYSPNIAGVFALSSFLSKESKLYEHLNSLQCSQPNIYKCPLFMCHGNDDDLIFHEWGQETYDNLIKYGIQGEFHTVDNISHELEKCEINKLIEWINRILPPSQDQHAKH